MLITSKKATESDKSNMFSRWESFLGIGLVTCFASTNAQLIYLDEPELLWTGTTTDGADQRGVRKGNGIFTAPDGKMIVSTSFDATVRAFDSSTGEVLWTYTPNSLGFPYSCLSGVTFNYEGPFRYLVYAIADAAIDEIDNPVAEM